MGSKASGRRIVVGVGNPDRGDDVAGRVVARLLRDAPPEGFQVSEKDGEATALLAELDGAAAAYIIDACASGAAPGIVSRFDAAAAPLPSRTFALSSHGLGLAETIELARALKQLPPICVVYAIEGGSFETGAPLSPPVAAAVATVAERLRAEIAARVETEEARHA
ncbi:MAG: hydrogenase maturation protease [Alphaproteobacteria bacterium]|nr:hydrogenase maturation protease [Alphaproteobacteria bacterium]MBM3654501.1 hydrogenase maturation protease [Alphaproteobacteria bacterium]